MTRSANQVDRFVGARIAWRRTALGLSQTALAQQLGVTFQQVQKYEAGSNRVSASRLHRIATVLGASVADFFPPRSDGSEPGAEADWLGSLRFMTATSDGRSVAAGFPLIEDRDLREAVARIVQALAQVRAS